MVETAKSGKDKTKNGKDVDTVDEKFYDTRKVPDSQICKGRFYVVSATGSVSSLLAEIRQVLLADYKLNVDTVCRPVGRSVSNLSC
ncbi:hypothetical protein X777_14789 [Ooceraea biroi]|uniref:Uncharacterized protein n=1 Tax=Ooceraea biroi TaxID=2015173 RepID=A0A026WRG7_OOCBI|nr:hypothetical protein X777_14789 [Ooceraea biroi]